MGAYTMNQGRRVPRNRLTLLHELRLQWWFWELLGATVSIFAFGAIVTILKVYDGHALPKLPADVTLNAIVSLLGTLSKATLLLVVSTAISQFKWLWFHHRSRKLRDLQLFDEASRGPWGALAMLRHSRKSMGSLGALIVLLLVAFDPLVQQVIATPQRVLSVKANSTALPKAFNFDISAELNSYQNIQQRLNGANPSRILSSTIANGASSLGQIADFTPSCPTANCTWPAFQSLGLCSTCKNVTEYARQNWECHQNGTYDTQTNNRVCTYKLPNTAFNYSYLVYVNGTDHESGMEMRQNVWTTELNQTDFSKNTFLVVSRIVMEETYSLLASPAREQVREATECAFAMCINQHDLSVEEGITKHTITSSLQPFGEQAVSGVSINNLNGITQAKKDGTSYQIDVATTMSQMAYFIQGALTCEVTADTMNDTTPNSRILDGDLESSSPNGGLMYTSLCSTYYAGFPFIVSMENMAVSISQYIRSLSDHTTTGQAHSLEVYVKVRWAWLIGPAVLIASGLGLLLFAIVKTERSGVEVWKSSSLPLFFCAEGDKRPGFDPHLPLNTTFDMESEAAEIRVQLGRDGTTKEGWTLQADQIDPKTSPGWDAAALVYSPDIIGRNV